MKNCLFCSFARGSAPNNNIFYEDEKTFAMLDEDWAVKGHSLVVWKEHARNMSDLSEKDFAHFSLICRKVEQRLLSTLKKDKSIVLKSGGLEPHFHFHIYPVDSDTDWESVKKMFDKKVTHIPSEGEKETLLKSLGGI